VERAPSTLRRQAGPETSNLTQKYGFAGSSFLVDAYGADGLPFNTRFGNGDPIGADVVHLLNNTYEATTAREPWQAGDLLLVDNLRTAHSREPFTGPRDVLVAMADPVRPADTRPTVEMSTR
jgi:hypothetical protein